MKIEQYNEDKFNWCKNLIDTALDGSIDLEQLQNIHRAIRKWFAHLKAEG